MFVVSRFRGRARHKTWTSLQGCLEHKSQAQAFGSRDTQVAGQDKWARKHACFDKHNAAQALTGSLGSSRNGAPCPAPVECPRVKLLVAAEVRGTATPQRQASGKAAIVSKNSMMVAHSASRPPTRATVQETSVRTLTPQRSRW